TARVAELVGRHDPRAERTERVEALPAIPLAAVEELQIARGDVVRHRVAEDVIESAVRGDVAATPANHDSELDLPVDLRGHARIDADLRIRPNHAGRGLAEEDRLLRRRGLFRRAGRL